MYLRDHYLFHQDNFYFSGRKAVEGSILAMMLCSPAPRSHGTLPVHIPSIHAFGYFALRKIARHVQHRAAPMNYPVDSKTGEVLLAMLNDLRLCLQAFSPSHGKVSP